MTTHNTVTLENCRADMSTLIAAMGSTETLAAKVATSRESLYKNTIALAVIVGAEVWVAAEAAETKAYQTNENGKAEAAGLTKGVKNGGQYLLPQMWKNAKSVINQAFAAGIKLTKNGKPLGMSKLREAVAHVKQTRVVAELTGPAAEVHAILVLLDSIKNKVATLDPMHLPALTASLTTINDDIKKLVKVAPTPAAVNDAKAATEAKANAAARVAKAKAAKAKAKAAKAA